MNPLTGAEMKNQNKKNLIPRKGDKAMFISFSPALRNYGRWATVERGGLDRVVIRYPSYHRLTPLEVDTSHLLFHRGGIDFEVR